MNIKALQKIVEFCEKEKVPAKANVHFEFNPSLSYRVEVSWITGKTKHFRYFSKTGRYIGWNVEYG